eukprot:3190042-Pleurochrysis_carterae.AAC.1
MFAWARERADVRLRLGGCAGAVCASACVCAGCLCKCVGGGVVEAGVDVYTRGCTEAFVRPVVVLCGLSRRGCVFAVVTVASAFLRAGARHADARGDPGDEPELHRVQVPASEAAPVEQGLPHAHAARGDRPRLQVSALRARYTPQAARGLRHALFRRAARAQSLPAQQPPAAAAL